MRDPLSLHDLAEIGLTLDKVTHAEVRQDGSISVAQYGLADVVEQNPIFARHLAIFLEMKGIAVSTPGL